MEWQLCHFLHLFSSNKVGKAPPYYIVHVGPHEHQNPSCSYLSLPKSLFKIWLGPIFKNTNMGDQAYFAKLGKVISNFLTTLSKPSLHAHVWKQLNLPPIFKFDQCMHQILFPSLLS
jgi:hypothetical protein